MKSTNNKGAAMNTTFEVGQTYTARSIGDSDCVFAFEVVKRTAKFITITNAMFDGPKRVGTYVYEGREAARPYGTYSMAPTIYADRSAS
jgi:hypothetical protein